MTTADWRAYVPLVRMATAKCPVSAILTKVREAAREFCTTTRLWRLASEAADVVAGQAVYGLRPPAETDICTVLAVSVAGRRLRPVAPDRWLDLPPEAADRPVCFVVSEPNLVHLHPDPTEDIDAAFTAEVALEPAVDSTRGPQFLLTKYGRIIAKGAQAELLLIPDRPWTDAANGTALATEFKDDMAAARIAIDRGGADAPVQVNTIPFF